MDHSVPVYFAVDDNGASCTFSHMVAQSVVGHNHVMRTTGGSAGALIMVHKYRIAGVCMLYGIPIDPGIRHMPNFCKYA